MACTYTENEHVAVVLNRDHGHVETMRVMAATIRSGLGNIQARPENDRARTAARELVERLLELERVLAADVDEHRKADA
jgi:hypothetical protein